MKAIQLLPLAFLADVHGFIYFVPYMLLVMVIAQALAISRRRRASRQTVPVPASIIRIDDPDVALAFVRK